MSATGGGSYPSRVTGFDDEDAVRADAAEDATAAAPFDADAAAALVPSGVRVASAPWTYRASLALVAAVAVLLPLFYAVLAAGTAAAGVWILVREAGDIHSASGARSLAMVVVLIEVVALFLVKPLFARRAPPPEPFTLVPGDQPALHAFVRRAAAAVGSPVPVRIDLDLDANASASFRRSFFGFGGGGLVLTIGAPLLATFTVEQLGAVLAHELGHFRQGAGMRCTCVLRSAEFWFRRVVHERDAWDAKLAEVASAYWPFKLAQGGVWLTRRLLALLAWISGRATALVSRQMEMDADSHTLALTGGPALVSSMRRVVLADCARGLAFQTVDRTWTSNRLPDDIPALVVAWRARIEPGAALAALREALDARATAASTHPCLHDRLARATTVAAGPLRCDRPARALLCEPDDVFRRVTWWHYGAASDGHVSRDALLPSADAFRDAAEDEARAAARDRWARELCPWWTRPRLATSDAPTPATRDAAVAEIAAVRAELTSRGDALRRALVTMDAADTRRIDAFRVPAVIRAGGDPAKLADVSVSPATAEGAKRALAEANAAIEGLGAAVRAGEALLARRLRAGAALIPPDDADWQRAVARLAAVEALLPEADALRAEFVPLPDVFAVLQVPGADRALAEEEVADITARLRVRLASMRRAASALPDLVLPSPEGGDAEIARAAADAVRICVGAWDDALSRVAFRLTAAETAAWGQDI